jgi:hypothetical protein
MSTGIRRYQSGMKSWVRSASHLETEHRIQASAFRPARTSTRWRLGSASTGLRRHLRKKACANVPIPAFGR